MGKPLRILLVEDNRDDAALVERQLRAGGYEPVLRRIDTAEAMREALRKADWDAVVADYNLPGFSAIGALEVLQASRRDLPFIIVSGGIGEEEATAAMKAGAHDYVMKDNLKRLVPAIEREIRDAADRHVARRAEEALRESEARYRVLFEHAPDAIVLHDCETGRFIEANPEAERLFGLPRAELVKRGPASVGPERSPTDRGRGSRAGTSRALRGAHIRFEWMHRRVDGAEIPSGSHGLPGRAWSCRDRPRSRAQGRERWWPLREELRPRGTAPAANVEIETFLYGVPLQGPLVALQDDRASWTAPAEAGEGTASSAMRPTSSRAAPGRGPADMARRPPGPHGCSTSRRRCSPRPSSSGRIGQPA
jgi:PAS domain S-box-containing protein